MKENRRCFRVALIVSLCFALCLSSCKQSSEDAKTQNTVTTPVASLPLETSAQKETPTPIPTLTSTPVPVERKDVRIIGLMIGTGIDAHNKIKNPTSTYNAKDSIFALVRTSGSGPEATIKLSCKDKDGNVVFEESKKIMPKGEGEIVFTLTAAKSFSAGEYHLMGLLDNYPEMAVSFEVSGS